MTEKNDTKQLIDRLEATRNLSRDEWIRLIQNRTADDADYLFEFPVFTIAPATIPTLLMLNTSRTSIVEVTCSFNLPDIWVNALCHNLLWQVVLS